MATRRRPADTEEMNVNAEAVQKGAENAQDGAEKETGVNRKKPKLWEGYSQFVYIGPSLPGGLLKKNAVLIGEFEQIKAYLAPVLEQYPQAERLLYPVEKAGYAMKKAQAQGNIVHKCYADLVSLTSARMKEE